MADQEEMCRGELAPPLRLDNDRGVVTEGGWGRGGVAGVGRFLWRWCSRNGGEGGGIEKRH